MLEYLRWKIKEIWNFLYDEPYSEEDLAYYKSIGCEGKENEKPYDHVIIYGGALYFLFFLIYVGIFIGSGEKSFIDLLSYMIMGLVGLGCVFILQPLMIEDYERMERNTDRISKERRRTELKMEALDYRNKKD